MVWGRVYWNGGVWDNLALGVLTRRRKGAEERRGGRKLVGGGRISENFCERAKWYS